MSTASTLPEILVPPLNFAMVCPGVYRSGYPTKKNYPFLRALRLRSVLYLCPEDYAEGSLKFCEESGISVLRFPTEGNKEPFNDISEPLMHRILSTVCDVRNLPVLIHCNKGKHRTGTVVAALRHLQGWSLVSIFEEYKSFAGDKARVGDQQYIELYYPIVRLCPPYVPAWFQPTPRVKVVYSEQALLEEEVKQLGYSLLAPDLATPGKMTFNTVTVGAITTTTSNILATASPTTTTGAAGGGVVGAPVTPVTSNNTNNEAVSPTGGMTLTTPAVASTAVAVNTNISSSPTAANAGAFASQSVTRTLGGFANAMPSRATGLTPPAPIQPQTTTTASHSVPSGSAKMNTIRNAAPPRRSPNAYASSATLLAANAQPTNQDEEVQDISTTQIGESASVEAEEAEEGEGGSSSNGCSRQRRGNTALQESSMSLQSPAAAEEQSDSPITPTQDAQTRQHHHHHHKSNNNNNNNESRTASNSGGNNSATLPPTVAAATNTTTCTSPGAKQRDVRRETRSTRKTHSSSGNSTTAKGAATATTTTASDT